MTNVTAILELNKQKKAAALNLDFMGLKTVPVILKNYTWIKKLSLKGNNIKSIDNGTLPNGVVELDLSRNNFISFDCNCVPPSVETLNLSYNDISQFNGEKLNVTELNISYNKLELLKEYPPFITKLSSEKNQLHTLNKLPSTLVHLDCCYNFLTSVPDLNKKIQYLNISNNKLTGIITVPDSLTFLNVSDNDITGIVKLPKHLKTGIFNDNQIKNVTSDTFHKNMEINILSFTKNTLKSWPKLDNVSIKHLILVNNNIRFFEAYPKNIYTLNLSDNCIDEMPIKTEPTLRILNIFNNFIQTFPELNDDLEKLNLSKNQIVKLPQITAKLIEFNISDNSIEKLTESLPSTLKRFYAKVNFIEKIDMYFPAGLEELYLSDNEITVQPTLPTECLEIVDLSNNKIRDIGIIPNCVIKLDISQNAITEIPVELEERKTLEINYELNEIEDGRDKWSFYNMFSSDSDDGDMFWNSSPIRTRNMHTRHSINYENFAQISRMEAAKRKYFQDMASYPNRQQYIYNTAAAMSNYNFRKNKMDPHCVSVRHTKIIVV